ncbi:MAG: methionine synthase [Gemmatimonadales bacterium]|nr:methionine synthase [Gemmatimonadales bacterium]NIN11824.1 methionine synthase [Gemmatimonadales bacterium]NIN50374.1 methionine synthase [Gemmatimonadales bacterium]NIP07838.1 methionine synthase [Gemmatimonadales bacterium]NIR00546.1 methionine synthase [Gemmatimonadales bacterium]
MKPLAPRLASRELLIADGAIGTMLIDRGLNPGQCPESVTLSLPTLLEEIAQLYLDAGADIIETNTFGASPLRLARYGLEAQTEAINREAVRAVRNAAGDRAYVAGSCGPSGMLLKPYGESDPADVYDSFRVQMECLIAAGVDCVFVETMVDLEEAKLAVRAAKDFSPATPVMATMTFDATPRGFYTIMGVSVEAAALGLREAGADAVGSNCGNGTENMIEIAKAFRSCSKLPLIIQPNAGMPRTRGSKTVYHETPRFMADRARELLTTGVSIIGGCCGTTPEHISALRAVVDGLSP